MIDQAGAVFDGTGLRPDIDPCDDDHRPLADWRVSQPIAGACRILHDASGRHVRVDDRETRRMRRIVSCETP